MLDLWLIRHGESTFNAERRIQGTTDAPLSERGREQARRLARRLEGEAFDAVWASDLDRALHTARLALPDHPAGIRTDPRIREIDLGRFEGRRPVEMTAEELAELEVWYRGPFDRRVAGGESTDDLRERVESWIGELPDAGRVAAFSHGGAIGAMLQVFLGRPDQGAYTWGVRIGNTGISRLRIDGASVLLDAVNDVAHLAGWEPAGSAGA
jgi:broad specificity phosphatase PhoE